MQILEVVQGSPEWDAARAKSFNASEASAMLGLSSKVKRNELLRMKKTFTEREFSNWVRENLLERGHLVEAGARALAEAHIHEQLYPITGYIMLDGDMYLASFDGITMGGETVWENKLYNAVLVAAIHNGEVPPEYWPQLEHQLLVSGAEKVYFTTSDGTEPKTKGFFYHSVPERRAQLIAGWKQFKIDLDAYQAAEIIPAKIGTPVKTLPAITYRLNGLALTSNLAEFKAAAAELVEDSKRPLETDQDFSDRETLVKSFKEAEDRIALVQSQVVGEIKDVDEFCRGLGDIAALIRVARLNGEKQIQARKDAIRLEILEKGKAAFAAHIAGLNTRLGKPYMPVIMTEFGAVMKGKRTIASLQDAVDTELARAKIEANAVADRIQVNLNSLRELASEYTFLFADTAQIVLKASEDLVTLVKLRISEHKAKEEAKLEAERERIRKEEADKLEREQRERERQEAIRIEAERIAAEKLAEATKPAPVEKVDAQPTKPAAPDTVEMTQTAPATASGLFADVAAIAAISATETLRASIDEALADMTDRELIEVLAAIDSIRTAFGRDPARRAA